MLLDAKDAALSKDRRKVKLTARINLVYTNLTQRTQAYRSKASRRSRGELSLDFVSLSRMKPLESELVQTHIEDGLLRSSRFEGPAMHQPKLQGAGFRQQSGPGPIGGGAIGSFRHLGDPCFTAARPAGRELQPMLATPSSALLEQANIP